MKKRICKNCQYGYENHVEGFGLDFDFWCSNSKSEKFRFKRNFHDVGILETDTCSHFTKRGKKAPWIMRKLIKVLK